MKESTDWEILAFPFLYFQGTKHVPIFSWTLQKQEDLKSEDF